MTTPSLRRRRGFTLAEVMIALVLFGVVSGAAVAFLLSQTQGYRAIASQQTEVQSGRFTRDLLRMELRTAGTNVTDVQPILVAANDSVIAFNTDLLTNDLDSSSFTGSVYVDTYASSADVGALPVSSAITIPGTSPGVTYPLQDYTAVEGTVGPAELVIFRFVRDTTSTNASDVMITRQVNNRPPEIIATGLRRAGTTPFLRYWYDPNRYFNTTVGLDTVPRAWLPLAKTVAARGVAPDTGVAVTARIDQVRAVEVNYRLGRGSGEGSQTEPVRYLVAMPNTAAPRQSRACGRPPIAPASITATWNADSSAVFLSWPKATDDGGGESDAVRYVLWRQIVGAGSWGESLAGISTVAGSTTYSYRDGGVEEGLGRSYRYALAVQDCTPNVSSLTTSATVVVP
jgi:prepilin-type N-terminal cleavage/methylation domain-containing protein